VIESPYAGDVAANVAYARRCVLDCLSRGEAPCASHLFFTQEGLLDDADPVERRLGIEAGFAWGASSQLVAVYVDRGVSDGMRRGIEAALARGANVEVRALDREVTGDERRLCRTEATPYALLWLDLETTGLDPAHHEILELSYVLTSFEHPYTQLLGADLGSSARTYLVEGGRQALETRADAFVREMHDRSGLAAALDPDGPESKTALTQIELDLLVLSEAWPTKDKDARVLLAGNSVDFDRGFLRRHMPNFATRISHRVFDASSYYRFCRSLGMPALPKHEEAHRASADVRRSIELARTCATWLRGGR
jgi:oligoribonuclease (3'-5' exoribonuclease)